MTHSSALVYGGLAAALTSWAEIRGVPYQGVAVGAIKKHATGKGNANKAAMIQAARQHGVSPADAIAILLWVIQTWGGAKVTVAPVGPRRHEKRR